MLRIIIVVSMFLFAATVPAAAQFLGGRMPYGAFDKLDHTEIKVDGSTLVVGIAPGKLALSRGEIVAWVKKSAEAVITYYHRFPTARTRVLIVPVSGARISGQAFGHRGAAIRLRVGRNATAADLARDWVMVHEMIHLAFPMLNRRHDWLAEGLAVYIESVARVRAGHLDQATIWTDFVEAMPRGLPGPGDRGLDNTPTWGRTYWGGALFCLLADIEIRKRTRNEMGLEHALRKMLSVANHESFSAIETAIETADIGTGKTVLMELYKAHRDTAIDVDLDALWAELGVRMEDGAAVLDGSAPLAEIREAIFTAES